MQKVKAEMMPDINASSNDKTILNEFYDNTIYDKYICKYGKLFLIRRIL